MTRHSEIDFLRFVAIVMMVIYHCAYDLMAFYDWDINLKTGGWEVLRIITFSLFLLLSGVSSNFSKRPVRRALIVLGCAMIVSLATYVMNPDTFVRFGILHCIGTGMLLLIFFKRLKELNILLGTIILLSPFQFPHPHLSLDYYPLLPWFGLMLIGNGIGYFIYIRKNLALALALPRLLTLPGRYALLIYMVHQPIILGFLGLLS